MARFFSPKVVKGVKRVLAGCVEDIRMLLAAIKGFFAKDNHKLMNTMLDDVSGLHLTLLMGSRILDSPTIVSLLLH